MVEVVVMAMAPGHPPQNDEPDRDEPPRQVEAVVLAAEEHADSQRG
jgi:hypothetical protein